MGAAATNHEAIVHLYPFPPWGQHGGTMRLSAALQGSASLAPSTFSWWDPLSGRWSEWSGADIVGAPPPSKSRAHTATGIKRRVFPSTLYESGRHACAAAEPLLRKAAADGAAGVVLHTTYLAPLISLCRSLGLSVVADAYDLVWRVHADDAKHGKRLSVLARRAYSASVRAREMRQLGHADYLIAAGWDDGELMAAALATEVPWVPVGIPGVVVPPAAPEPLRVGILGNFAHSATALAARRLLGSSLSADATVEIVLAGLGSDAVPPAPRVTVLGPVDSVEEFYAQIHATVVPVENGSGMKCKLAEAALAGRLPITTRDGALGYAPELRPFLYVVADISELSVARVRDALSSYQADDAVRAFRRTVEREAAAELYARALSGLAPKVGRPDSG